MADLLSQGIASFNEGRYFQAHETWEDLWNVTRGARRVYYQGLVQIAVGLHHLSNGNTRGGIHVLERGIQNLLKRPADHPEIDNILLINDLQRIIKSGRVVPVTIRTAVPPGSPAGSAPDETV